MKGSATIAAANRASSAREMNSAVIESSLTLHAFDEADVRAEMLVAVAGPAREPGAALRCLVASQAAVYRHGEIAAARRDGAMRNLVALAPQRLVEEQRLAGALPAEHGEDDERGDEEDEEAAADSGNGSDQFHASHPIAPAAGRLDVHQARIAAADLMQVKSTLAHACSMEATDHPSGDAPCSASPKTISASSPRASTSRTAATSCASPRALSCFRTSPASSLPSPRSRSKRARSASSPKRE